jgi:uncharacterized protein (DUF849 family)
MSTAKENFDQLEALLADAVNITGVDAVIGLSHKTIAKHLVQSAIVLGLTVRVSLEDSNGVPEQTRIVVPTVVVNGH